MNAVRKIVDKNIEYVAVPKQFRNRKVEVLFFPVSDFSHSNQSAACVDPHAKYFVGAIPDFPARIIQEEQNAREELL